MSAVHIRTPFTSLAFITPPAPSPYIVFVYTSVPSSALDFVPAPRAGLMAESDAAIDVRDTFGMLVIGTILGSIFYGITLLQTGIFLGKRSQERFRTSVLVRH